MIVEEGDGDGESPTTVHPPDSTASPAEFTAALRVLRTWSGLTYRQLAGRAKELGGTLPASTVATTLGRTTLPRESFVETFTRACGLNDEEVRRWLDSRTRIAMGASPRPADETKVEAVAPPEPEAAPRRRRWRAPMIVAAFMSVVLVGTLGYLTRSFGASSKPKETAVVVPGLDVREVGSWVRIRPARSPEFCLAEGTDRTRLYPGKIVAQQTCGGDASPHLFLDPVGEENAVQIQWHHPETGVGCVTVVNEGLGHDLLEPRDDCDDDGMDQLFTIGSAGPAEPGRFVIRPAGTSQCLGLRDLDTVAGTEVVRERCSGAPDQTFLIELIPPP
ncbi:XRE family transcriptional regulator [Amycolatopsis keratiniphila]|uniref:XRE family transcriptional regulator n=1 Tax=Amycolatopsis keratiniphila TaxID=129921 RepID=UPI000F4E278D|nr:XRE family transcriptional regulator [Amycolatopsis keratiniphila]